MVDFSQKIYRKDYYWYSSGTESAIFFLERSAYKSVFIVMRKALWLPWTIHVLVRSYDASTIRMVSPSKERKKSSHAHVHDSETSSSYLQDFIDVQITRLERDAASLTRAAPTELSMSRRTNWKENKGENNFEPGDHHQLEPCHDKHVRRQPHLQQTNQDYVTKKMK